MYRARFTGVLVFLLVVLAPLLAAAQGRWTVRGLDSQPLTSDSGHLIEGTATASKWAWHAKLQMAWAYDIGLADEAHQTVADLGFGLGLPLGLEVAVGFPVGWTVGTRRAATWDDPSPGLVGMSDDGPAAGDLRPALMWNYESSGKGGFGLLLGAVMLVPTGDHERLMGEGGVGAEPFVSIAFEVLSTRLSLNLAYRLRPEHRAPEEYGRFEQDDDLIWRFALRIPRKNDVAWSFEAMGAIGILTREGPWPGPESRPVVLLGGVDFPTSRLHRLGMFAAVGVVGEEVPDFQVGMRFTWMPIMPDEDRDGVGGAADECPLLPEDRDGFEDSDGCPDGDNDRDGFPDDEDECPLDPAGDFSEDGC